MKQEQTEALKHTDECLGNSRFDCICGMGDRAIEALPRLLAEREALLGALKMVEWRGGMGEQHCSLCGCYSREWGGGHGHAGDCKLNAALALAES